MKTLTIDSKQTIINDATLVNTDSLLDYIDNDNFDMTIYGFSRKFKGSGHYEITIDTRCNGEWETFSTITTCMMDLDMVYSDEISSDEDIKEQASCFESLIAEILRENKSFFEE